MASFTGRERQQLARALARGGVLECPVCGGDIDRQKVAPPPDVAYVRHRVWLLCTVCRRSGAVDEPTA